jgi:hypothetical protein
MKINSSIFVLTSIVILSTACSRRAICPAFQSSFLLESEEQDQFFSLFVQDTLPKQDHLVIKDNRGLLASVSYKGKKKSYEMAMVPMEVIYPSLDQEEMDSLMLLARLDTSAVTDSTKAYQPKLPGHNRDQRIYMELFGEYFYEQTQPKKKTEEEGEEEEKGSWFKRLFNWKKKDKQKEEEENQEKPTDNATSNISDDMAKN